MSLLRRFSAIKIAGSAERIVSLKDFLAQAEIDWPRPLRVLGNGSNVLMDDQGLRGTVILTREDQPDEPLLISETEDSQTYRVSSGFFLPALCRFAEKKSLSGCEYMVGVPGTLGGAVVQNAGANEQELKDICVSVEVFDLEKRARFHWSASECEFAYRSSRFQKESGWIVLSADLKLVKVSASEISARIQKNLEYRKTKTPWTRPTLGSTFTRLPQGEGWLYPGRLIEDAGLKGFKLGRMAVSDLHANYIVNEGEATFDEAMALIFEIEKRVKSHSGIELHREIQIWTDRFDY